MSAIYSKEFLGVEGGFPANVFTISCQRPFGRTSLSKAVIIGFS